MTTRFFYQGDKLVTLAEANGGRTILRGNDIPLVEHTNGDSSATQLLATDLQKSVLASSEPESKTV